MTSVRNWITGLFFIPLMKNTKRVRHITDIQIILIRNTRLVEKIKYPADPEKRIDSTQ